MFWSLVVLNVVHITASPAMRQRTTPAKPSIPTSYPTRPSSARTLRPPSGRPDGEIAANLTGSRAFA